MAVELFPTFLARPESFRANKHHSLYADRKSVVDERPDFFKRRVGHELGAWRFLEIKEVLALRYVCGDHAIKPLLERTYQTEVTGARFPNVQGFPFGMVSQELNNRMWCRIKVVCGTHQRDPWTVLGDHMRRYESSSSVVSIDGCSCGLGKHCFSSLVTRCSIARSLCQP